MKHLGSEAEYSQERLKDILKAYHEYITSCEHIDITYICNKISKMPARRFWVSDIWASKIIAKIHKGEHPYYKMRPLKREMFLEIYKRVLKIKQSHPEYCLYKCCSIVVQQSAPKHYLSSGTIKAMICKEKKRIYEERKKRLRHCL